MANSTQRRATLAELSHVEGTKKGVDVHSALTRKWQILEERFIDAAQNGWKNVKGYDSCFLNEDIYKV